MFRERADQFGLGLPKALVDDQILIPEKAVFGIRC